MEMVIGGCAAAEATIPSTSQKATSAKFSGLESTKPYQQCAADQGSLRSRLSDQGVQMNMAFRLADFCSYREPPKLRNGTAQLTIFYAGTVNVYDVTADKAEAIIALASGGNNIGNPVNVYDVTADKAEAIIALASGGNNIGNPEMRSDCVKFGHQHACPGTPVASTSIGMAKKLSSADTFAALYNQRQNIHCDQLPLARKLSLQRFLEMRKERVISKSPLKPSTQLSLRSLR